MLNVNLGGILGGTQRKWVIAFNVKVNDSLTSILHDKYVLSLK
jgi:hypothetical protein